MNDRIRELLSQAGVHYEVMPKDTVYEKFAELIVRECINKVRSRQMFSIEYEHNIHHAFDLLVYDLESHFGVDE